MKWSSPLTDEQILGVMSDEGRGLFRGCHWGETTRHGVLDVDQGSKYHNAQGLEKLAADFAAVGLQLVPFQSSQSGGWHLYFYLSIEAPSDDVENTVKKYLKLLGYEILSGTLEVFPSGNGLRLPLQKGFAWLAPDGRVSKKREELSQNEALASFLSDLEDHTSNWSEAKNRIDALFQATAAGAGKLAQERQERLDTAGFQDLFWKGVDWEKYQRGQKYWPEGLTAVSQRHDAVICIGHYLWYGDPGAGLAPLRGRRNAARRAELISRWLESHHNGFSRAVNKGDWRSIRGDAERACSWSREKPLIKEREAYPLTDRLLKRLGCLYKTTGKIWTPSELEAANVARALDARSRIALAVAELEEEGELVTKAAVARRAGAHRRTVAKHSDLLACCASVINSGGFGGCPIPLAASGSDPLGEKALFVLPVGELETLMLFLEGRHMRFELVGSGAKDDRPVLSLALDSLRSKTQRSEGEQLNGIRPLSYSASLPFEFSYGVKHWRTQSAQAELSVPCGINGTLPASAGPLHLILGGLFVWRSARARLLAPGTKFAKYFFYGSFGHQSNRMWGAWARAP